jgi:hypothetical protein
MPSTLKSRRKTTSTKKTLSTAILPKPIRRLIRLLPSLMSLINQPIKTTPLYLLRLLFTKITTAHIMKVRHIRTTRSLGLKPLQSRHCLPSFRTPATPQRLTKSPIEIESAPRTLRETSPSRAGLASSKAVDLLHWTRRTPTPLRSFLILRNGNPPLAARGPKRYLPFTFPRCQAATPSLQLKPTLLSAPCRHKFALRLLPSLACGSVLPWVGKTDLAARFKAIQTLLLSFQSLCLFTSQRVGMRKCRLFIRGERQGVSCSHNVWMYRACFLLQQGRA